MAWGTLLSHKIIVPLQGTTKPRLSHQQYIKSPSYVTFSPVLNTVASILAVLVCMVALHCDLICIVLANSVEHLFRRLLPIHISFYEVSVKIFCSFFKWGWFLLCWLQLFPKDDSTSGQFDLELVIGASLMALLGSKLLTKLEVTGSRMHGMHKPYHITVLLPLFQWLPMVIQIKPKLFISAPKAPCGPRTCYYYKSSCILDIYVACFSSIGISISRAQELGLSHWCGIRINQWCQEPSIYSLIL